MKEGDFAAAEAEAAVWSDPSDAPTEADSAAATDAGVDGTVAAPDAPVADAPVADAASADAPVAPVTRTQVAVVGLVSVASIATFKRLLARAAGVRGVQVASGPDGEFLFAATHDENVDMPAAVAAIPGFEIEVLGSEPGSVNARAVDPEAV
jgi:hypothetical protein